MRGKLRKHKTHMTLFIVLVELSECFSKVAYVFVCMRVEKGRIVLNMRIETT